MKESPLFPPPDSKLKEVSLARVLESLYSIPQHYLKNPREYILQKKVTPDDLRLLNRIRIEISLMYDKNSDHLLLLTGSESSTSPRYRKWYEILGKSARAKRTAERHDLDQQYAATVHVHNHPPRNVTSSLSPIPLEISQTWRSTGGDKKIADEPTMDVAIIVTSGGILLHKGDNYARVNWEDTRKVQHVCDVINGGGGLSEIFGRTPSEKS